jgi:hypothetical protein
MNEKTMTLGEFRQQVIDQIKHLPDDTEIVLGMGDLSIYRCKTRLYRPGGNVPKVVQIEFNEIYEVAHDT